MTRATRETEYTRDTAKSLYVAFEVGAVRWKLGFTWGFGAPVRRRTIAAGDLQRLEQEIAEVKRVFGLPAQCAVRSCYEAGPEGFWLHRCLVSRGIDNRVVDSASIEVNRRQRRAKSDGLDVGKLLGLLLRYHAGEPKVWSVVRVPTVEAEDQRQLHREWRTLNAERTRVTNRIKGLLATQGIRLARGADVGAEVETLRLWDGTPLPRELRARLQREWAHVQFLDEQRRVLHRQRAHSIAHAEGRAVAQVRQLLRLKAIGASGAWVYVHEFFGWRQFRRGKEVGAAAGFVPTPYQSGQRDREQGISKAGSRHIRAVAVETAWAWLRHQPHSRLSRWYHERFGRGGPRARKVGIVALARKLLIELWRFLDHGVIPAGAQLKPA
jgi:transposase